MLGFNPKIEKKIDPTFREFFDFISGISNTNLHISSFRKKIRTIFRNNLPHNVQIYDLIEHCIELGVWGGLRTKNLNCGYQILIMKLEITYFNVIYLIYLLYILNFTIKSSKLKKNKVYIVLSIWDCPERPSLMYLKIPMHGHQTTKK